MYKKKRLLRLFNPNSLNPKVKDWEAIAIVAVTAIQTSPYIRL